MELTYLRTFCEVVDSGSLTRAAEKLGYAQSSVTAQMTRLEEIYGTALLERAGQGMLPTFAGRTLLPYARQMLAVREEARTAVAGEASGSLVVASIETIAVCLLPQRLLRFRERHPGLQLKVVPGSEPEIIAAVRSRSADIGLIFDRPFSGEGLVSRTLRREPLCLVVAPGHRFAGRERIAPAELDGEPLVLTDESCTYRERLLELCRAAGAAPRIEMELGHLEGILQAARQGFGAAYLPGYAFAGPVERGELVAVPLEDGDSGFSVQLVTRPGALPAGCETFIGLMTE
ncbi:LysR family transcriptional regulator [Paenibacillus spiritus]|uniref:LysR family transcriptional regulator n=1 Tax=Paenibacillus spiritus TaxID=2496557 RepID=A0A5J5G218_9BACL|nr:LysR family transcriptional regulator [Paenibacillus spiritus]KAA9000957.1 LysR family transcriptional regulator [Paenibacillus spiritus]